VFAVQWVYIHSRILQYQLTMEKNAGHVISP
jgi:hypothetical protein